MTNFKRINRKVIETAKKTIRFNGGISEDDLITKISKRCFDSLSRDIIISLNNNTIIRAIEVAQKELLTTNRLRFKAVYGQKKQKKEVKKKKIYHCDYIVATAA